MSLDEIIEEWAADPSQKLVLSSMGLTQWPAQLKNKTTLIQEIDLFDNELEEIPALPNLIEADFSQNKIKKIGKIPKCERLTVYSNNLKTLPSPLSNLTYLDASQNELSRLPKLPQAEIIDVSSNNLKTINPKNFPKVEIIFYDNNPLSKEPVFPENVQTKRDEDVEDEDDEVEETELDVGDEVEEDFEENFEEDLEIEDETEELFIDDEVETPDEELIMDDEVELETPEEELVAEKEQELEEPEEELIMDDEVELETPEEELVAEEELELEEPEEELIVDDEPEEELIVDEEPEEELIVDDEVEVELDEPQEEKELLIPLDKIRLSPSPEKPPAATETENIVSSEVKYTDLQQKKVRAIVARRGDRAEVIWNKIPNYPPAELIPLPPVVRYNIPKPRPVKDTILGELQLGPSVEVETAPTKKDDLNTAESEVILASFDINRVQPRPTKRGQPRPKRPKEGYYTTQELRTYARAAGLGLSNDRRILADNLLEWHARVELEK